MRIEVTARGAVGEHAPRIARERIAELEQLVNGSVLGARVVLTQEENPRIARPARAEGEIDVQGKVLHARAAEASMPAAVEELAARLRDQIRRFVDRQTARNRRGAGPEPGEWFHGAWSAARPSHYPRPPAEREIVRRKSFAVGAMTVAEAAADLAALDHDFFLFHDVDTDADALLYRRDDGRLAVIVPAGVERPARDGEPVGEPSRFSAPIDLATAVAEMNELNHRFLFYVDAQTGRGHVIYLRYDGHYGLIQPA